jgi:Rrf2 family transcriptional regulator, nitric oxide-sensitive transcriptional repressor
MRLSLHTDFSLRVLMYLCSLGEGERATTPALSGQFKVSQNHLQKVVQNLVHLGLVNSTAGRGGGILLAQPPAAVRLGWLIRQLESSGQLVDCSVGPCPLAPACTLRSFLDEAEAAFFELLDRHTLADTVAAHDMVQVLSFMKRA